MTTTPTTTPLTPATPVPSMRTAPAAIVLCPGQGAQFVGMGKAWAEKHPVAMQTFQHADEVLGYKLSALCWNGPEEELTRTDNAQPAIYTTSIACFRVLMEQGRLPKIAAAAGLSLGEFTALHLAGAYDFETGLKLVRLRGQAMQEAATAVASGMVVLIGSDEAQAKLLCQETVQGDEVLVPANFNCPGQIVLSGHQTACQRALDKATAMGIKAQALKVAGAFHSPIMKPAAAKLKEALDQVAWSTPDVPVMANVTGIYHEINKLDYVKQRLVDQLTGAVRWEQSMIWLMTHVPGAFIELAPGKSLAGMMKRIDRSIKVESFAEPQ